MNQRRADARRIAAPSRRRARPMLLLPVIAIGCLAPQSDQTAKQPPPATIGASSRNVASSNGAPTPDASRKEDAFHHTVDNNHASPAARLAGCQDWLHRQVPSGDLIEDLYLNWASQPYRRATLAVLLATLGAAERELAEHSAAAIGTGGVQVESILAWCEAVASRPAPAELPGFRPHRLQKPLTGQPSMRATRLTPPLVTFADRTSMDETADALGDFDVLACAGFRIAAVRRPAELSAHHVRIFREHADALGIDLVDAPLTIAEQRTPGMLADLGIRVYPMSLERLLDNEVVESSWPAVIDPAGGESWAGLISRRAMFRGASVSGAFAAVGCVPPTGDADDAKRMRAAMWLAALDGQRLSVLEGWSDLPPSAIQGYRCRMDDPVYLETVAHTALDLLRFSEILERFNARADIELSIDGRALHRVEKNRWSDDFLEVIDALIDSQISFDVVAADRRVAQGAQPRGQSPPRAVFTYEPPEPVVAAAPVKALTKQANKPISLNSDAVDGAERKRHEVVERAAEWLSADEARQRRLTIFEPDGRLAPRLFVRVTDDSAALAIVNLVGAERSLRISLLDGSAAPVLYDHLDGSSIDMLLPLAPYQVRILTPIGPADERRLP